MLILPGYWPDTYWSDRYWMADYWPEYGVPIPPQGTDRKPKRGREHWKPAEIKIILRDPPIQTIINRQRLARDMRVDQERLAQIEQQQRQAAIDAAVAIVELQAKDAAAAFERKKKSMASLAVANLAREKKRQADQERLAQINRQRMINLSKARKRK